MNESNTIFESYIKNNTYFNSNSNININNLSEEEKKYYFLKIDLEISNLEILASLISFTSSIYYLKASFIGNEIIRIRLSGEETPLDATPYVDVGETLGFISLFIFTLAAFKRSEEKTEENYNHSLPYKKISLSYIPTLIAYMNRINARKDILNDLPNI
ncbi:hypothetical protein J2Z53_000634 [Clostridium moniliforme]|uniref:Uncharacterized protein n=1 Tax=Clostridium moniliforme TaxID=39489 RepID=A0ABS4EYJ6_9CLOT|nr:hypothetical protein [Clostridium moniliforme]MBP1889055.1 hypothetical protein [Clostridium moniliforme]